MQWGSNPPGFGYPPTPLFTKPETSHKPAGGEHLFGYATGQADDSLVTSIIGGVTCGD